MWLASASDLPGAELMLNFPDYEADKGPVQRSAGWQDYHHDHLDTVSSFHIMHIPDKVGNFWIFRYLQGVPYYWAHFVFVIFSGSIAHTEELFIAIG